MADNYDSFEDYSRDNWRGGRAASSQRPQQPQAATPSTHRTSARYSVPQTERDFDRQLEQANREATRRSRSAQRTRQAGGSQRSYRGAYDSDMDARARAYSRSTYTGGGEDTQDAAPSRRSARSSRDQASAPKKMSALKKVLVGLLCVVLLAAIGVGVYVGLVSKNLNSGITKDVRDALVETEYAKEPFYMLLMGTDESTTRAADEFYGGTFRSDSMMLARIDCPNKKVTLISLERDTLVDMGANGVNKLNAASAIGGAAYSIEIISKLAGVPISHYAQVNFDGFCSVVDTLGGIEVDVPVEIDDPNVTDHLYPGLQVLNGDQALSLCRSRNSYNNYGSGNEYRSANQRMVLSAIAQKILAADIPTIAATVQTLSNFVTTDIGMTDIVGMAQAMRGLNMAEDMYTAMQPTEAKYDGEMWYNVTIEPAWTNMIKRVDQGLPPLESDVVDATGTVMATTGSGEVLGGSAANVFNTGKQGMVVIRNGGAPAGSGGVVGQDLEALGYDTDIANASRDDYKRTLVVFNNPSRHQDALEIAQSMGVGQVVMNNGEYNFDGDLMIILGADYVLKQ